MTTLEILEYYKNLLILQYKDLPKASATIAATVTPLILPQTSIQVIALSQVPTSGFFTLVYKGTWTSFINYNDTAATIQTYLRAIAGLDSVTVTGSFASQEFTITFDGVPPVAELLEIGTKSLAGILGPVVFEITETDVTLPIAIQNAYNLSGDNPAVGVQLDVLGKYAGVTRNGNGFQGQAITLDDADFLTLIRLAIVTNNSDASLETIQNLLHEFFPNEILITDYLDMRISYRISETIGSADLIEMFVTQQLLPKPMGVQMSVVVIPDVTILFAFRTYRFAFANGKPFNRYTSFNKTWRWLSYANVL